MNTFKFLVIGKPQGAGLLIQQYCEQFQELQLQVQLLHSLEEALPLHDAKKIDGVLLEVADSKEPSMEEFLRLRAGVGQLCLIVIGPLADRNSWHFIRNGAQDFLEISNISAYQLEKSIALALQRQKLSLDKRRLKAELEQKMLRYQNLYQTNPHAHLLTEWSNGKIIEVNEAACRLSGYSAEEMTGNTTLELELWESENDRNEMIAELERSGEVKSMAFCIRQKGGKRRHVLISARKILLGQVPHIVNIVEDNESNYRLNKELEQREQKYRSLVDQAPSIIFLLDSPQQFNFVGAACLKLLGYSPNEMMQMSLAELAHSDDQKYLREELLPMAFKSEHSLESREVRLQHKEGEERIFKLFFIPMPGKNQQVEKVQGIAYDTTETFLQAQALQTSYNDSQLLLRRLKQLEVAIDQHATVAITDSEGTITYVNDLFCQLSEYSREELVGKTHHIINSGVHPPKFWREFWRTIKAGQVFHGEVCNKSKSGKLFWMQITVSPRLNSRGEPVQYFALRTNITERKRAEIELAKSKDRLRNINNSVDIEIWAVGTNYKVITFNQQKQSNFARQYGRQINEGINMCDERFMSPDEAELWKKRYRLAFSGLSENYEDLREVKGQKRYFHISISPYFEEDGSIKGAVAYGEDITKTKKQALRLAESERQYRMITENMSDFVWATDLKGHFSYISPSVENLLGYRPSEYQALKMEERFYSESGKALNRLSQEVNDALAQARTLLTKEWRLELKARHKKGHSLWLLAKVKLMYNAAGAVEGYTGMATDITERKKAQDHLRQSNQRMADILDALPDMIFILDKEGKFLDFSAGEQQLLLKPQEFLGRNIKEVMPNKIGQQVLRKIKEIKRHGKQVLFEYSLEVNGQNQIYEARVIAINAQEYLCVVRNQTDHKQYEQENKEAALRLKLATETSGFGVWDYRPLEEKLIWDDNMFEIFGLEPKKFNQRVEDWVATLHPDDREWAAGELEAAAKGEKDYRICFRILRQGQLRYIGATAHTQRDERGRVVRILGLNWDVTERESAAQEIAKALQEREAVLNSVQDGFASVDSNWNINYWNEAAAVLSGRKEYEAKGQNLWEVLNLRQEDRDNLAALFGKSLAWKQSLTGMGFSQNRDKWLKITAGPLTGGLSLSMHDMTESLKHRREIENLKRNREALINATQDLIWLIDPQKKLLSANQSFDQFCIQLIQRPLKVQESVELLRDYLPNFEKWTNWYQLAIKGEMVNDSMEIFWEKELHILKISLYPVFNNQNQVSSVACYAHDISEKVKNSRLLKSQNEKLREIAWMQSHLVRAPLARLMGILEMIESEAEAKPQNDEYMKMLSDTALELDKIIHQISDNARIVGQIPEA